jgi:serine/threonine protein kinase
MPVWRRSKKPIGIQVERYRTPSRRRLPPPPHVEHRLPNICDTVFQILGRRCAQAARAGCWHAEIADAKSRTKIIAEALEKSNLPYFVGFNYFEEGIMTQQGMQPIVVMDWVNAQGLKKFLANNIFDSQRIEVVAENFRCMVAELHRNSFSHGDLQHGNIMIKDDNSLVLVDYDSMYVPALKGMTDDIKGLVGYQHKARWKNKYVSEKADYFSELIIYISLIALAKYPQLWDKLNIANTETLLFSGEDLDSLEESQVFKILKGDQDLEPMLAKLSEYLRKDSIEDFEPLESVLVSKIEKISSRWKNNGFIPRLMKTNVVDSQSIKDKWLRGNGYTPIEHDVEIKKLKDVISSKFKKPE